MKRLSALCIALTFLLCSCNFASNDSTNPISDNGGKSIVGKWIDNKTEQIIEYTADGYYYEYINEAFTADKTKYVTEDGKIYYYLDGDAPDYTFGIDYEIKNGNLIIAGEIDYRPLVAPSADDEAQE